jgi:hypothetical protein
MPNLKYDQQLPEGNDQAKLTAAENQSLAKSLIILNLLNPEFENLSKEGKEFIMRLQNILEYGEA